MKIRGQKIQRQARSFLGIITSAPFQVTGYRLQVTGVLRLRCNMAIRPVSWTISNQAARYAPEGGKRQLR